VTVELWRFCVAYSHDIWLGRRHCGSPVLRYGDLEFMVHFGVRYRVRDVSDLWIAHGRVASRDQ
jgi:hypothetical protein